MQREIEAVNYNMADNNEQLTIFDYELMEQVAM
ncbi:Uncharacterised protein [Staphylococcus epidermidis]|nr:Uncharacterised protein [Staphylococcus epidermidis]SUM53534.1 Uncharacterised protein [Staphylococcus epidermidis]